MKESFFEKNYELVHALSQLININPFTKERFELEKKVLKDNFIKKDAAWSSNSDNPNADSLAKVTKHAVLRLREDFAISKNINKKKLLIYRDVALSHLFHSISKQFYKLLDDDDWNGSSKILFYNEFLDVYNYLFKNNFFTKDLVFSPEHCIALCFQTTRAFNEIYHRIFGSSQAIIKLRSEIWQSIFTHKMHQYWESRYLGMNDVTTLITGASGTGKELVARAIALSRYIPFNSKTKEFKESFNNIFYPINLSALSPTLIESELFGHAKGAFTGALQNRAGYLETCSEFGTVFLDEIAEVPENIQVKMLRVIQERNYQKLGETNYRKFNGKIIAATNRNFQREIEAGNFRADFYYRLCSDMIQTPSLKEQLEDNSQLEYLVKFLSKRIVNDVEVEELTKDTMRVIEKNLGSTYEWAGNVRELDQCVRNVFIRGNYIPFKQEKNWLSEASSGSLTADKLLNLYCKSIYQKTGTYADTSRITGLDRRTKNRKRSKLRSYFHKREYSKILKELNK